MGAKVSFNIADRVITETRHDGALNASDWRWHDNGTLRWNPIRPNYLKNDGTRVEVRFNHHQGLDDIGAEYLIEVLMRHYFPLFVTDFLRAYQTINIYPTPPRFVVNGSQLHVDNLSTLVGLSGVERFELRSKTGSVGWGAIGISEHDGPIGDGDYGVLLCTYGKAIKSELFGLSTGLLGARLFGIVEIPGLIQYLTTNKTGLKGGPGRTQGLNQLLDPVREQLRKFLSRHGIAVVEQHRNQLTAKLERELTRMVKRLPELQDFDGLLRRSQRLRKSADGVVNTSPDANRSSNGTTNANASDGSGSSSSSGSSRKLDREGKTPAKRQRSRNNQGPRVAFEDHPERNETAWLDSDTIVINSGHTAYCQRISQDQARLTYCMFAIGVALDKAELVESDDDFSYVDKFIAAWGQQ